MASNSSVSSNDTTLLPGAKCVDIDECAEGLSECQHTCENNNGSYICHCPPENLKIDRSCYPIHMPRQIIQFDNNVLRIGTLGLNDLSVNFENYSHACDIGHPSGLTYDHKHRKLFFLSSDRSKIFHDMNPKDCKALVSGRSNIEHMAIDYEFENMYWIEGGNLHVKSVLTGHQRLLREFNDTFRSMMIDPVHGFAALVGSKWVYKVDLDGGNVEHLYENLNISRVFLDADGSPIYLLNDTLISCPTMGAKLGECLKLSISAAGKRILGVYMNFILLINEKNLLEVVSENSRSEFLLSMQYSNDTLFEVVQNPKKVNTSHLCQFCEDICLNSGSNSEHCICNGLPCSLSTSGFFRAFIFLFNWETLLITIPAVLTITVIVIATRRFKKARRILGNVGLDLNGDKVAIEPPQTRTPCIDVPMKSNLIVDD